MENNSSQRLIKKTEMKLTFKIKLRQCKNRKRLIAGLRFDTDSNKLL